MWDPDPVKRLVERATVRAMNHVMAECVTSAKGRLEAGHHIVTATLHGSIRLQSPVKEHGNIVGHWGSFDVNYAIFLEKGTVHMSADPYLQPSADEHYLKLPGYMREEMAAPW